MQGRSWLSPFHFNLSLEPRPKDGATHNQDGSLPFSSTILEASTQTSSKMCLPGDSKSTEADREDPPLMVLKMYH